MLKKNRGKNRKNHWTKVTRKPASLATLRPFFRALLKKYHQPHWLYSDPVQFAHRYEDPRDQEIVAFLSCCFAYGSVKLVHRAIEAVLKPMGPSPYDFVRNYQGESLWAGFSHRFHKEAHLIVLIKLVGLAVNEYGSLGECFRRNASNAESGRAQAPLMERSLNGTVAWFKRHAEKIAEVATLPGVKFFFNAPEDGSACKRLAMFFRWMVRKDEIDFGLWTWIRPSELVIPVDTHVGRISHYLRLRSGAEGRSANWAMACEITRSLAEIDPEDPVSFDFALARLGILDICKRRYAASICARCPLAPGCRFSNLAGQTMLRP